MPKSHIESLLEKLPNSPGVYKMKNADGVILYVGKAKNLRNRVRSYFRAQKDRPVRTQKLLENIADLQWIEVGSDLEALFLETNLIKELRPRYNVLMKDDKNFVYIKITKEDFPRIELVRRVEKDGARYFGPKTSAGTVRKTLMLLQKLFLYRSCDLGLQWDPTQKDPKTGATRITKKTIAYPCLDFHIKRCAGPCIGKISPEDYKKSIDKIQWFLEGKTDEIEKQLNEQMNEAAQKKEFEKAAHLRDKVLALKNLRGPSQVATSPDQESMDISAFVLEGGKAYFNLFNLREGKLLGQENFIADSGGFEPGDEEQAGEVMEAFLYQFYEKATSIPSIILIPYALEEQDFLEEWLSNQAGHRVHVKVPERGRKHQLLELAEKNARSFQKQHKARWEGMEEKDEEALLELARHLGLPKPPKRIECYDISHLSGTDTVASMVVLENGRTKNSDYRKFRLKTLANGEIDDFKSMKEILFRRLLYLNKGPKGVSFKKAAKSHQKGIEALLEEWRGAPKEGEPIFTGELKEYTVAVKNKKVIGLLRLTQGTGGGKQKSFLQKSFYVTPDERSLGVGKALLRWSFDHKKAQRIYLSCDEKTFAYYDDFGFEEVKQMPEEFTHQLQEEAYLELKTHVMAYDPSKHHDASFQAKPNLIVIDGGKGQLSHAKESADALGSTIPMIGLAKREEEVFVPEKSLPLLIPRDSRALLLLQKIRDEAHRFAITFQRSSRKKYLTASALDEIMGMGPTQKSKLLTAFGSVEQIRKASEEELVLVVGEALTKKIIQKFKVEESGTVD